jgi:hypothetical protein
MVEVLPTNSPAELEAIDVLHDLRDRGYRLTVRTRTETHDHKVGAQAITYADKLQVRGDDPIPEELCEDIAAHRDELLAAACVLDPPVRWILILVERYLSGEEIEVRRDGYRGPYRVRLAMLAANVASFIGLHPAHDGPRLEPIIREVLQ